MEKLLNKTAERKLLDAVRDAIHDVTGGMTPDAAIAKHAAANLYNADFTRRMVELYNTSRTLAHYKHAKVEQRAHDFELADADRVLGLMYEPAQKVAAARVAPVDADFMRITHQARFNCKAAEYERNVEGLWKRAQREYHQLRGRHENTRVELEAARTTFHDSLTKLADYFRTPGHDSFLHVEKRVKAAYPEHGTGIMDITWKLLGSAVRHEKRAEEAGGLLDTRSGVGKLVDNAIKAAERVAHLSDLEEEHAAMARDYRAEMDRLSKESAEKRAFDPFISLAAALAGRATRGMRPVTADQAYRGVLDPLHEMRLNSIKTEAALQDLMANDPVISRYHPTDVVEAFNTVSQLAPNVANKSALLRAYMRRLLEGGGTLEPFEVKQLASTAKDLSSIKSPYEAPPEPKEKEPDGLPVKFSSVKQAFGVGTGAALGGVLGAGAGGLLGWMKNRDVVRNALYGGLLGAGTGAGLTFGAQQLGDVAQDTLVPVDYNEGKGRKNEEDLGNILKDVPGAGAVKVTAPLGYATGPVAAAGLYATGAMGRGAVRGSSGMNFSQRFLASRRNRVAEAIEQLKNNPAGDPVRLRALEKELRVLDAKRVHGVPLMHSLRKNRMLEEAARQMKGMPSASARQLGQELRKAKQLENLLSTGQRLSPKQMKQLLQYRKQFRSGTLRTGGDLAKLLLRASKLGPVKSRGGKAALLAAVLGIPTLGAYLKEY